MSRERDIPRAGATKQEFSIITNPDGASLKRVAWAYGCSKKDSAEECQLHDILVAKVKSGS